MSSSELLMWFNLLLVLVLVLALTQKKVLPVAAAAAVVEVGDPGPTFSSTTEVGVDLPVQPVSPSWPYTEFPRRSAGSVRWAQSSMDSAPYYTGKLRPMDWRVPVCHDCHSDSHMKPIKEGLETNVAVESKQPSETVEGGIPGPQTKKPLPDSVQDIAKTTAAKDAAPPSAPASAAASSAKDTAPPATAQKTETPASATATAPQTETTSTPSDTAATKTGGSAVSIGGSDALKATVNTGVVGGLVQQKTDGSSKSAAGTTVSMDKEKETTPPTISVAEKQPVLPASALTETVKSRLQLLEDLGTGTQGGEMAQPLYLLTLLQQNQHRSQQLDKEINEKSTASPSTSTATTTTTAAATESRVQTIPA